MDRAKAEPGQRGQDREDRAGAVDPPDFLPMGGDDTWAEGEGLIDLDSEWMAAENEAVADFVARANYWYDTWLQGLNDAGDDTLLRGQSKTYVVHIWGDQATTEFGRR